MATEESRDLTLPEYKTSLTPPPWPTGVASDSAAERKLARAEMALEDVARREHILATQIKAHRHCALQLAEERALLEAERINHAKKVKLAEEALIRMREQLAVESESLDGKTRSHQADVDHKRGQAAVEQDPAQIATDRSTPQDAQGAEGSERKTAPDAGQLLSRLAKQATDFAALAGTVTELQRQLAEERSGHEVMATSRMEELRKREDALAHRESETHKRINEVNAGRESLTQAQEEFATAKREGAEWLLRIESAEADLVKREQALTLNTEKFQEEKARLTSKANAITAVEDGHRQRENELLRLEQDVRERAAELARRQSELATTEAEVRAAGRQAVAAQEALDRLNAELDAGLAKLRSETEAVALIRQEQADISATLEQRSAELVKREATIEHVAKEADAVRQQALELREERLAVESKLAGLKARETALEKERRDFDERRRTFRESLASFMEK